MGILDLLVDSSLCRYIIASEGFGATDVFRAKAKRQRDVDHSFVCCCCIDKLPQDVAFFDWFLYFKGCLDNCWKL